MERVPPENDVASLVSAVAEAVDAAVLQALEGSGLRRAHGYVVQRLLVAPSTASEIAAELGVSQQAVSKLVAEMLELGHVEPARDDADRRRRPVRLSAAGRQAVGAARAARAGVEARLREAVGDERFEVTRQVLVEALEVLQIGARVRDRTLVPPDDTALR